ncbi:MAG: NAD(P)H-dependent oxidoreductase [Microthrixaceae bacterium]
MSRLLVVHHTPSPRVDELVTAMIEGACDPSIEGVEVLTRAALVATATDVISADGYLLATPANLGYMSGALKHFFDTIYYPCLRETTGRPYGLMVHGNNDVDGAVNAVKRIVTGLDWREVHLPVRCTGESPAAETEACWELGATLAATLAV